MSTAHRLAHRKTGTGPDVLFIHGWPLHGATWRNVIPHLTGYTCHVIDLPGTGASTWSVETPITLRAHADAVLELIASLALDRVALVAHDSGGAVARLVAATLGNRCNGVVLGNTEIPAYRPPMLGLLVRLSRVPGGGHLLPLSLRMRWSRRAVFAGCFDDLDLIDGEFGRLFVDPIKSSRGATGQLGLVRQFDWSVLDAMADTHAKITAPVSLIWGKDDPWFPLRHARAMVDQFPGGAELVELPGKLFVHEERPGEWAAIAKQFLDRARRSSLAAS